MTSRLHATLRGTAIALAPLFALHAVAATESSLPKPVEEMVELDEIWVHGQSLAERIEAAEDDFFELYNKLNTVNRYDVKCGTAQLREDDMRVVRWCAPEFRITRKGNGYFVPASSTRTGHPCQVGSSSYTPFSSSSQVLGCAGRTVSVSPGTSGTDADYAANVQKVVMSDARLREKAVALASLYEEMEKAQERYIEAKPVPVSTRAKRRFRN
jgi:hypothetical protein